MQYCTDDHGLPRDSWEEAHRVTSVDIHDHWHPVNFAELQGWMLPGADRVRDREFDVVTDLLPHTDPDQRTVVWVNLHQWFEGTQTPGEVLVYEIGVSSLKRFFLLPHEPVTQEQVDEALASIRRTYEERSER